MKEAHGKVPRESLRRVERHAQEHVHRLARDSDGPRSDRTHWPNSVPGLWLRRRFQCAVRPTLRAVLPCCLSFISKIHLTTNQRHGSCTVASVGELAGRPGSPPAQREPPALTRARPVRTGGGQAG